MVELSPQQTRSMRDMAALSNAPSTEKVTGSLAERWEDLHAQASQLAKIAQLAAEPCETDLAQVPNMLGDAPEWQRELAWQTLEDIDAMMQPGMVALRTILARGQNASAPALALWRELHAARGYIIDLAKSGYDE